MSESSAEPQAVDPTKEKSKDSDERMKRLVERRLAQPAVRSQGHLKRPGLADLAYEVRAQFVPVLSGAFDAHPEEPEAAVFTIAYLASDDRAGAQAPRPVCFAFNGGPGSASIWLHLGALGPKRVAVHDDGTMPTPPYTPVDNLDSWLPFFDLVFIDPPHTGYSVTASRKARKKMLGVDGDVAALTEVMHAWLATHQRFASPVYLVGESYGTTRGAAIADKLLDHGIALSGLILVSCAMDLQTLEFAPGNDLPFALFLPGYAGTAQYHGKLVGAIGVSSTAARQAAEAFVVDEYLVALHRGGTLTHDGHRRIAQRVAELTGLAVSLVEQKNLRISDQIFFTHLLRDDGRLVGRLDSRVTGPLGASRSHLWELDPSIDALAAPYTMAAQSYFAGTLGLPAQQRYHVLSEEVYKKWKWNRGEQKGNSYACTSPDLARALRRNPHLRVLVASGHYDLGTPYSATNYSLSQVDVPPEVAKRISHHYYDAGHMMYTRSADLSKLHSDLSAWLKTSEAKG
jgi:carboxypeptidase C (cathepsin A)